MRALALVLVPLLLAASAPSAPAEEDPVRIAILDSGILSSHGEFRAGQVVAWRDFVNGGSAPYDDQGHGTATASRAAGATIGSCPGCDLIIGKVLDEGNFGLWVDVANGIRWATDEGASVISVSIWAGAPNPTTHLQILAAAIAYAHEHDVLVVWIAGNGGGTLPHAFATTLPGAASSQALIVGAANENGIRWGGSQLDPELLGPGANVRIAWRDGATYRGTGTSYAAPWVAGAAARLLLDGAPRSPDWLEWVLLHAAKDQPTVGDTYLHEGYGFLGPTELANARAVARGDAPVPGPDARDAFHLATLAPRIAQSGQAPSGALPP